MSKIGKSAAVRVSRGWSVSSFRQSTFNLFGRTGLAWWGLALFCFAPVVASGQTAAQRDNRGELAGNVTGPGGTLVAGANVRLTPRADGATAPPKPVQTDDNGHYEFQKIEPGIYLITVEAEGFKKLDKQV